MLKKSSPLKHNEVAEEIPHDALAKEEHDKKHSKVKDKPFASINPFGAGQEFKPDPKIIADIEKKAQERIQQQQQQQDEAPKDTPIYNETQEPNIKSEGQLVDDSLAKKSAETQSYMGQVGPIEYPDITKEMEKASEEQKKEEELKKDATTAFENYKKKKPSKFSTAYAEKGDFKAVADYEGDPESISEMNTSLMSDYLKNNDDLQNNIIPDILSKKAKILDANAEELYKKYNISEDSSQEDLDKANNEYMEFQSGFIVDDPRFRSITKNYQNELSALHLKDKNSYLVDKYTWDPVKTLDYAWNLKTGTAGPMAIY